MTKLLIALSALVVSTSAFANTSLILALPKGGNVILTLETGFAADAYPCASVAAEAAGRLFTSKYNVNLLYVDQVKFAPSSSSVAFTVRTSAQINGQWRHQYSRVTTTTTQSCTSGGAELLSESAD